MVTFNIDLVCRSTTVFDEGVRFEDCCLPASGEALGVITQIAGEDGLSRHCQFVPISVEDAQLLAQAILVKWPLADQGDNEVVTEGEDGEPLARGAIDRELPEVFEEMIHEFGALEDAIINAVSAHREMHEVRMSRILGNARKLGAKARILARRHRAIKEQFELLKAQLPIPEDETLPISDTEAW